MRMTTTRMMIMMMMMIVWRRPDLSNNEAGGEKGHSSPDIGSMHGRRGCLCMWVRVTSVGQSWLDSLQEHAAWPILGSFGGPLYPTSLILPQKVKEKWHSAPIPLETNDFGTCLPSRESSMGAHRAKALQGLYLLHRKWRAHHAVPEWLLLCFSTRFAKKCRKGTPIFFPPPARWEGGAEF